jgi:bacterioferritin-associated ferredoxin
MYLCICNAVKQGDTDSYHLIGTKCGKCIEVSKEMVDTSTK